MTKTSIEIEYGLDLDAENPDTGKGIAAGIKIEKERALFYSGMEGVLHNHILSHFFRFLSSEKNLQKDILEKAKKALGEGKDWIRLLEYDQGDIEDAFSKAGELTGKLKKDAGDIDVVTNAMKSEGEATKFYERFADSLRGRGNDFFRALADREQRHHDLLAEILALLKQA